MPPLIPASEARASEVPVSTALHGGESGNESDCSSPGSDDGWSLVLKQKP